MGIFCILMKDKDRRQKIFLLFNTSHFGDVLLCNSLCQNIKIYYPNSKIVYIVNKPLYDAAKYQKDVDEVISFDKFGEHKGLLARLKFIIKFPYKNADYTFISYRNNTNSLIARLIFSRHIIEVKQKHIDAPMQEYVTNLLTKILGKKVNNLPIKYQVTKELPPQLQNLMPANKNYIGLCTVTTNNRKDIPLETAEEIINKLCASGYSVLYLGIGEDCQNYAKELSKRGCEFINLVGKTSIPELGTVLQNCKALISADTGTMHMACAVGTPVVSVFYIKSAVKQWQPDTKLYKSFVIDDDQTAENIYNGLCRLLK